MKYKNYIPPLNYEAWGLIWLLHGNSTLRSPLRSPSPHQLICVISLHVTGWYIKCKTAHAPYMEPTYTSSHYQEDMGYQIIQKMPVINKMACRPILHSVGSVFFRFGLPFGRPVANTWTASFVSEKIQENTV